MARRVALASAGDVDRAVRSARAAFAEWSAASLAKRTTVLFAYRELLTARRDDLARIVTSEHGKTFDDARGEVQRGLEVVEFACGIAQLMKGEGSEQISTRVDSTSYRRTAGRRRGDHAVQLPGDGPDVDVPAGAGLRQRVHPQAE